jgi:hypothetical protein
MKQRLHSSAHHHTPQSMKSAERDALIRALQARFEKHMQRHAGIAWVAVEARLERSPDALRSLHAPVFVHHDGAQSYYAAHGFRGEVRV